MSVLHLSQLGTGLVLDMEVLPFVQMVLFRAWFKGLGEIPRVQISGRSALHCLVGL